MAADGLCRDRRRLCFFSDESRRGFPASVIPGRRKSAGQESRYTHGICAQDLSRRLTDRADGARKRVFCVAPECGGELLDNLLKPGRGESRH
jgi:hypothetical protein